MVGIRSVVKQHHSKTPLRLKLRSGGSADFPDFISSHIPAFRPNATAFLNPLLPSGHLQTCFTQSPTVHHIDHVFYLREICFGPDGGTFTVDHAVPRSMFAAVSEYTPDVPSDLLGTLPDRTRYARPEETAELFNRKLPVVIVLHGLAGGSNEAYVRSLVQQVENVTKSSVESDGTSDGTSEGTSDGTSDGTLNTSTESPESSDSSDSSDLPRMHVCVINSRGCAGSRISTPRLFCALWTNDIRQYATEIRKRDAALDRNRTILGVGFSLGGAILGNYLGQDGAECALDAAAVVSAPWDLSYSDYYLRESLPGRFGYSRVMAESLKRLLSRHMYKLEENPVVKDGLQHLDEIRSIHEFDNWFTCRMFGFATAGEYYRKGSPIVRCSNIRKPTVVINALDDPVVGGVSLPFDEAARNPYLLLLTTSLGGHIGWFRAVRDENGCDRWYSTPLARFFRAYAEEVVGVETEMEPEMDVGVKFVDGRLVMAEK